MNINFISSGPKTFVEKMPEGVRSKKLAAKIYSVEFDKDAGFFLLEIGEKYSLPEKVYGDYDGAAARIIKTHSSKSGNTGILLTGLKGTGKTLFVRSISNKLLELGFPILQINKPYDGKDMFNFIENIGACGIIFDEFGKNYTSRSGHPSVPSQDGLLSLFDGLSSNRRIHIFTENNISNISEFLINRPGRVHYHFKYDRLDKAVITEYCVDQGVPQEVIDELLGLSSRLKVLSFDVISCLIDEWKLHGGSVAEHLKVLNVTVCNNPKEPDVELISFITKDGVAISKDSVEITYTDYDEIRIQTKEGDRYLNFRPDEAIAIEDGRYTFFSKYGETITVLIRRIK